MPIYQFKCPYCKAITEDIVKIGTKAVDCSSCGYPAEKIISQSTFILKGKGWYADGYSKKEGE